jgi:hypothetical protein
LPAIRLAANPQAISPTGYVILDYRVIGVEDIPQG